MRLSILCLQAHVQALEGLLVEDQVLLLAGSPLENDASLASCGVSEHCTLEVAGRLLGGQYPHPAQNSGNVFKNTISKQIRNVTLICLLNMLRNIQDTVIFFLNIFIITSPHKMQCAPWPAYIMVTSHEPVFPVAHKPFLDFKTKFEFVWSMLYI